MKTSPACAPHGMNDVEALWPSDPRVFTLHPGDVVCAVLGEEMETLLGSCVAIILTDPRRTVATMCHVVHRGKPVKGAKASTSHGPLAMARMESLLMSRGIVPSLCDAYVYGGGNMFPDRYGDEHVGRQNALWALHALRSRKVRVVDEDLGGPMYRRVHWRVGSTPPQVTKVAI